MQQRLPRIFNIAAGAPFLEILADEVFRGFPLYPRHFQIEDWTILLPTRRASRRFAEILREKSGKDALLLPRIKPIGDLDEERLNDEMVAGDLPPALASTTLLFELWQMSKRWARANSSLAFAAEIANAPQQSLNLAKSLVHLVETAELQECSLDQLGEAYDLELADHRASILSLLKVVSEELPTLHISRLTMGAAARRSAMIKLEARRISQAGHLGPIIAAGSTGTIPATRTLLEAIARHEQGAVILPGLDQLADEDSWLNLPQEHAQFAMKQLIETLGVKRADVAQLGPKPNQRNLLCTEMLRPTQTAAIWHEVLPGLKPVLTISLDGLCEIAAPDRHVEARAIATLMRHTLEVPSQTATLVTPDRDLATRVSEELRRWQIKVEDSAGRPLTETGRAAVLDLLLQAILEGLSLASSFALLRHPAVTLGLGAEQPQALRHYELAVLHGTLAASGGATLLARLHAARREYDAKSHQHPLVAALSEKQWESMKRWAEAADQVLAPVLQPSMQPFHQQVEMLTKLVAVLCPESDDDQPENAALADFLESLVSQNNSGSPCELNDAAIYLREVLVKEVAPQTRQTHPRLAIMGTLEARLMPSDVVILGGLNEGIWPAQADPGPWLNRTMREKLGLPQPERDIGLAGHDFEQAFCNPKTYLTWSHKLGGKPANPSRWLLRLATVLAAAHVQRDTHQAEKILYWAQSLDGSLTAESLPVPISKPAPTPPSALRPRHFSVTEVEKLIRNPYAVYAMRILKLDPLPAFGPTQDAALRGSLFHDAVAAWNKQPKRDSPTLLAIGKHHFIPFADIAEIRDFWWPHFQRVAEFLGREEPALNGGLLNIYAELSGKITFDIEGASHELRARADRIDLLAGGQARIIDYKTGQTPSADQVAFGLSPQLPLEAAILVGGGFKNLAITRVAEALYMRIGGGRDGLALRSATSDKGPDIMELATKHLAGLKALLAIYQNPSQSYVPRLRVFKEGEAADYDHLSRFREWQMAGQ